MLRTFLRRRASFPEAMKGRRIGLAALATLAAAATGLYEHYALSRQKLQMYADNSAQYAVEALLQGGDPSERVLGVVKRHRLALEAAPQIETPPVGGGFSGDRRAVRVRLAGRWRPRFLLGLVSAPMEVRATAAALPSGSGLAVLRME